MYNRPEHLWQLLLNQEIQKTREPFSLLYQQGLVLVTKRREYFGNLDIVEIEQKVPHLLLLVADLYTGGERKSVGPGVVQLSG